MTMLPLPLLLAVLLLLPAESFSAQQVSFSSHLQLDLQEPPDQDQPWFKPSVTYPLPPNVAEVKTKPTTVYRPRSLDALHSARLLSLRHAQSEVDPVEWDALEVEGPDIGNLNTLIQLARMSANAYALPGQKNWYEVDAAWNKSFPFGWEESDGFRGHVFLSSDNSTIVLSIKGTTLQGPTSKLDKFNDNLLFSCCCARVDLSWIFRTVCDCYSGGDKCDNKCLTNALVEESLFYSIGVKLLDDLLQIYPQSNVWLVGHSLGGALASLLGATYGLPAVTFESPGERLAASRLHLPLPPPLVLKPPAPPVEPLNFWHLPHFRFPWSHSPPDEPPTSDPPASDPPASDPPSPAPSPPPSQYPVATTHVYHNADPIPQGTCTGFGSPCAQAGYALETRCHLGQSIIFDAVNVLDWSVDVRKHTIKEVVHNVLEADVWWGDGPEPGPERVFNAFWWWGKHSRKDDEKEKEKEKERKKRRNAEGNVPSPIIETDCIDCFKWEFGDFKKDKDKPQESS